MLFMCMYRLYMFLPEINISAFNIQNITIYTVLYFVASKNLNTVNNSVILLLWCSFVNMKRNSECVSFAPIIFYVNVKNCTLLGVDILK